MIGNFVIQNIITPELAKKVDPAAYPGQISGNLDFSILLAANQNMASQKHKLGENQNSLPMNMLPIQIKNNGVSEPRIMQTVQGQKHISILDQLSGLPINDDSDKAKNIQRQNGFKEMDKPNIFGGITPENITNSIPVVWEQEFSEKPDDLTFSVSENKDKIKNNIKIPNPQKITPRSDEYLSKINSVIYHPQLKGKEKVVRSEKTDIAKKVIIPTHGKDQFVNKHKVLKLGTPGMIWEPVIEIKEKTAADEVVRSDTYRTSQVRFGPQRESEIWDMIKPHLWEKDDQQEQQRFKADRPVQTRMQINKVISPENQAILLVQLPKQAQFPEMFDEPVADIQEEPITIKAIGQTVSQQAPKQAETNIVFNEPFVIIQEVPITNKITRPAPLEFSLVNSESQQEGMEINPDGLEWPYNDTRHIDKTSENNEPDTTHVYVKKDTVNWTAADKNIREVFIQDPIKGKVSQSGNVLNVHKGQTTSEISKELEITTPGLHEKFVTQKQQPFEMVKSEAGESISSRIDSPEEKPIMIQKLSDHGEIQQNQQFYVRNPETLDLPVSEGIRAASSFSELENRIFMYMNNMKLAGQPGYMSIRLETRDLGNIKLRILLKDSKISATIIFDRLETMKTMEMQMPDIRRNLEKNQIQVSEFKLSLGNEFTGSDQRNPDLYGENTDRYVAYNYGQQRKGNNNEEFDNVQFRQTQGNTIETDAIVDIFI